MKYEKYKVCEALKPKEICLVVEQYEEGFFVQKYHEHVPEHRLSDESLQALLQSLVLKFQGNEPQIIVRSFLNDRGKEPARYKLMWHVDHPEPGVIRKYCGSNTKAWADKVIVPSKFRPAS